MEDAVQPVTRRGARSREGDEVDGGRLETEFGEERVDRKPRVAGVVLQPSESFLRGAADDATVPQHGRRRAVCLVEAENDHPACRIRVRGSAVPSGEMTAAA